VVRGGGRGGGWGLRPTESRAVGPGEGRKDGVTGSRETGEEENAASLPYSLSLFISFLPPNIPTRKHTRARAGRQTPKNPESLR